MKKIILLLSVIVFIVIGCGKDDPKNQILDPNAMVLIKPDKSAFTRAHNPKHLSALEIVKQTWTLTYRNYNFKPEEWYTLGFADIQRDTIKPALKMWGTDIIDQKGNFVEHFLKIYDGVLTREISSRLYDTIGYLPNKMLKGALEKIKAEYDKKNYTEVYRLFDEAFTFRPITGAEWRELKKQDKQ